MDDQMSNVTSNSLAETVVHVVDDIIDDVKDDIDVILDDVEEKIDEAHEAIDDILSGGTSCSKAFLKRLRSCLCIDKKEGEDA